MASIASEYTFSVKPFSCLDLAKSIVGEIGDKCQDLDIVYY